MSNGPKYDSQLDALLSQYIVLTSDKGMPVMNFDKIKQVINEPVPPTVELNRKQRRARLSKLRKIKKQRGELRRQEGVSK